MEPKKHVSYSEVLLCVSPLLTLQAVCHSSLHDRTIWCISPHCLGLTFLTYKIRDFSQMLFQLLDQSPGGKVSTEPWTCIPIYNHHPATGHYLSNAHWYSLGGRWLLSSPRQWTKIRGAILSPSEGQSAQGTQRGLSLALPSGVSIVPKIPDSLTFYFHKGKGVIDKLNLF